MVELVRASRRARCATTRKWVCFRACDAEPEVVVSTPDDEVERTSFHSKRLKALGLSLGEIKDLNAVYAIEGSTRGDVDPFGFPA